MNRDIGNKQVYPLNSPDGVISNDGITYREALILSIAGGIGIAPPVETRANSVDILTLIQRHYDKNATDIIAQADAIITQLNEEK